MWLPGGSTPPAALITGKSGNLVEIIRSFEKGLAERGGWHEEILHRPEIQASFLYPFSYAPLGEGGTYFWRTFWALFGGLFVANPLPPTPFRNLWNKCLWKFTRQSDYRRFRYFFFGGKEGKSLLAGNFKGHSFPTNFLVIALPAFSGISMEISCLQESLRDESSGITLRTDYARIAIPPETTRIWCIDRMAIARIDSRKHAT